MTRAIRIKPSIDGHLFVVDIPSVVSQSGQAAFPSLPILKKAVEIRAIKKYVIVCDRSEAEILWDAAKKYCPEAVSEIDAVIKLASYS
jgi:hypothetical protein